MSLNPGTFSQKPLAHRALALIEDDVIMGESLLQRLELEGAKVTWWRSIEEARSGLNKTIADAVICDIRLPDGTGEDLYRDLTRRGRMPPFLFMTGFGDVEQAVRLMREGAHDYVTKPFEMDSFLERLQVIMRPSDIDLEPMLGPSDAMRAAEAFLKRAARVSAPVLVTGETGVGKEVVTRLLHALRPKPTGPFMAVNCAALPADLMESELFGHERGAFTGAQSRHLGYAERAGTGLLFLDEIGELAPKLQAKLLRLIEDRSFHRLGGEQAVPFRARLVCATNADLMSRVASGEFREDLLYRINVLSLRIAPLRDRTNDIAWLMDRVLADLMSRSTDAAARSFSASAYITAEAHLWPGNVREMRNRIERALALTDQRWIMPADLFPEYNSEQSATAHPLQQLDVAREEAERRHIQRALALSGDAVSATAKVLGISRTTLWEKMKRYGLTTSDLK